MELRAYLDAMPADLAERFASIRVLIRRLYPEAIESMRYRMSTFEYRGGCFAMRSNTSTDRG